MPPALKTDQHPITFSDRNDFDAAQLIHLYRQAPWAKHRALEQAQAMLAKTDVVISAWDGTRLVGFGRVLTDYVFRASIWDVIVDREGKVRAAVIDFGGFLGVGSRKIVVDWNALHFGRVASKRDSITLELTKEQVTAAPEYKEDAPVIVLGAAGRLQPWDFDK